MSDTVDISGFMRDWRRLQKQDIPEAIVRGFARTANRARDQVRQNTRMKFKLHSEWIPKKVLSIPGVNRPGQIKAAAKGLTGKHADFTAAVFVKGADIFGTGKRPEPKKDLGFMTLHEEGGRKESADGPGMLAIPGPGLKKYSFKTGKGRTKKSWKPAQLLQEFNRLEGKPLMGKGSKTPPRYKVPSRAFIMKTKNNQVFIARRKTRKRLPVEILYHLKDDASIRAVWGFARAVEAEVRHGLFHAVNAEIRRVR